MSPSELLICLFLSTADWIYESITLQRRPCYRPKYTLGLITKGHCSYQINTTWQYLTKIARGYFCIFPKLFYWMAKGMCWGRLCATLELSNVPLHCRVCLVAWISVQICNLYYYANNSPWVFCNPAWRISGRGQRNDGLEDLILHETSGDKQTMQED